MSSLMKLDIPNRNVAIYPGCRIKLGRFDSTIWIASHGWYSWGGNRPVCGWYLTDVKNPQRVKPLQLPDLDDIHFIQI